MKILFILLTFNLFALDIDNLFLNEYDKLDKFFLKYNTKNHISTSDYLLRNTFEKIEKNGRQYIAKSFHVPPELYHSVKFWFNIYTSSGLKQVVVHDKNNLGIVYDILDFSDLHKSEINRFTKFSLQTQITMDRIREIKSSLLLLIDSKIENSITKKLNSNLRYLNITLPKDPTKKSLFVYRLMQSLRAQTGQKTNVELGIKNLNFYQNTISKYFDLFKLPRELLAIPLVESSFNPKAQSKAGASGAWQFIKRTGKVFFTINKKVDQRLNPLISTLGAFHLLNQNYRILRRWDLAITAYNSGTRHILRAKRKLSLKNVGIAKIFKKYEHPHIGFASQNYFSEILAMVYALKNKSKFYKFDKNLSYPKADIYVSKCGFKPNKLYKLFSKNSPSLKQLNRHLKYSRHFYPKGSIFVSDILLTSKRYLKLNNRQLRKIYPKNWYKLVRKSKCK